MSNVTSMYANNTALNSIRDRGYGQADFDIATAPLVYLLTMMVLSFLVLSPLSIEQILDQSLECMVMAIKL